ncbi:hypothetical protein K1T71_001195 [Dendrolimus kikuchii]|uniref:Uncharacterized protein n=1 Tax=Dendrolimus kikuchii TaxID=765133 RepID=A0ACC1DHI5_9NEOP|nr:hypothetical protein K1T71_001195 [Dendrolimus kikuchii]
MAVYKNILFIIGSVLLGCESKFVDTITKCSIKDSDCHKQVVQGVLKNLGKGIPEKNIPPIDPMKITNVSVDVLGVGNLTLVDGVVLGITDCKVAKFETSIEDEHAAMDLICDITIKGQVSVFSDHEIVKNLLGMEKVDTQGYGKAKMEKVKIHIDYFFNIEERDGKTFIHCKFNNTIYSYDVEKMTFDAKGFEINGVDMSSSFKNILNQFWKVAMSVVGKTFMDKAMVFVYDYTHKFFDFTPTDEYLSDTDLMKYVKKSF